jgi:hypothetical protein
MLGRHHQQQHLAARGLGQLAGGADYRIEGHARQIAWVFVAGVDRVDQAPIAGPEHHLVIALAHRLGKGGPPRPAAEHRHPGHRLGLVRPNLPPARRSRVDAATRGRI